MKFFTCCANTLKTGCFLTRSFFRQTKTRRSGVSVGALRMPDTSEVAGISPRRVSYSSGS
ncbi:hypothetical protein AXQ86_001113 [Salmonella enterica subsp. enterica serovar Braenderup]|nr:hypothetical protein [Salmonella enterica subsp. enterica serovar Braenderup]